MFSVVLLCGLLGYVSATVDRTFTPEEEAEIIHQWQMQIDRLAYEANQRRMSHFFDEETYIKKFQCPPGEERYDGECVDKCPEREERNYENGKCKCRQYHKRDENGNCECESKREWKGWLEGCKCKDIFKEESGFCKCKNGGFGESCTCLTGHIEKDGKCQCANGGETLQCKCKPFVEEEIDGKCTCMINEVDLKDGICECKNEAKWNKEHGCKCKAWQIIKDGECEDCEREDYQADVNQDSCKQCGLSGGPACITPGTYKACRESSMVLEKNGIKTCSY